MALGIGLGGLAYGLLEAPIVAGSTGDVAMWVADRDGDQVVGMDKDFFVQRSVTVRKPVRLEAMAGGTFVLSATGGSPIGKHVLMFVDDLGLVDPVGTLGAAIDLAPGPDGGVYVVEMGLGGALSRVLHGIYGKHGGAGAAVLGGTGAPPGGVIARALAEFASLPGATCVAARRGPKPPSGALQDALRVLVGDGSGGLSLLGAGGEMLATVAGLASAVGDVAPAPGGGWWMLDVAAPSRLVRLDAQLEILWAVETGMHVESLAPVEGQERVWLADTAESLVRRFGPGGVLEVSVPTVSSDFSRGEGRSGGDFWLASPGAALHLGPAGGGLPGQGGFSYLTDLSAVLP
jgi:hypothetical protein